MGEVDLARLRQQVCAAVEDARSCTPTSCGAGVADDKPTHSYVEDMIRFYLGEEPRVRSVQTLDLARRDHLEQPSTASTSW